ncbi:surface protein [Fibrobacter sp. UWH4]|nr:surface protein [Fibrobacter sp. UWH4]
MKDFDHSKFKNYCAFPEDDLVEDDEGKYHLKKNAYKKYSKPHKAEESPKGTVVKKTTEQKMVVAKNKDDLRKKILAAIKQNGANCDLNFIDVSKITDMSDLFSDEDLSQFTGDISQWDVSNVTNMSRIFQDSQFNGDISRWDVSKVINMVMMFRNSDFNGDISKWNVSNVEAMSEMFASSKFQGNLDKWNVPKGVDMSDMFEESPLEKKPPKWYKKK